MIGQCLYKKVQDIMGMPSKEHVFNIPLKETEDKVVFEIVIDKTIYKEALKSKEPIDILISVKTSSNDLEFDIRSDQKYSDS